MNNGLSATDGIRLASSNPPIFEFETFRDSKPVVIKAKALYWNHFNEDARQDKLKTSVERFSHYKNIEQWLACFEYQQLDEWPVEKDNSGKITALLMDCFTGLNNILPGPLDNQLPVEHRIENTASLLDAYAELVDLGYMNMGGDCFANKTVEFEEIVTTSNGRLLAELAARTLDRVLSLVSSKPIAFHKFDPRLSIEDVAKLKNVESKDIAYAAGMGSDIGSELDKIRDRFIAEVQLLERPKVFEQPQRRSIALTSNNQKVLVAMFELDANHLLPIQKNDALAKAGIQSEGRSAFKNLADLGYYESNGRNGIWLTPAGFQAAKKLLGIED